MRRITALLLLASAAAWGVSLWLIPPEFNTRAFVKEAFYITGMLSWALMTLSILIALRPAWLERFAGEPLDRLYAHHRRLGWGALALGFLHYFTKTWAAPLAAAAGVPRGVRPAFDQSFWNQIYAAAMHASNGAAVWLTWAAAAICLVVFVRAAGYSRWLSFHRLLSVIVLLLAPHCLLAADRADWTNPFGWINLALTSCASVCAALLLARGPGKALRRGASVESAVSENGLTRLSLRTETPLGAKPGAFVFLSAGKEPPHPFSLVRCEGRELELAVKHLGGWTSKAVPALKAGDRVTVEGPWGGFTPVFDGKRQTWVAAGIGIAPFIAWLRAAEKESDETRGTVELCWCVKDAGREPLMPLVRELAGKARVTLRVFESKAGRAAPEEILSGRPERLSVCGAKSLLRSLSASPACPAEVKTEEFEWRRG